MSKFKILNRVYFATILSSLFCTLVYAAPEDNIIKNLPQPFQPSPEGYHQPFQTIYDLDERIQKNFIATASNYNNTTQGNSISLYSFDITSSGTALTAKLNADLPSNIGTAAAYPHLRIVYTRDNHIRLYLAYEVIDWNAVDSTGHHNKNTLQIMEATNTNCLSDQSVSCAWVNLSKTNIPTNVSAFDIDAIDDPTTGINLYVAFNSYDHPGTQLIKYDGKTNIWNTIVQPNQDLNTNNNEDLHLAITTNTDNQSIIIPAIAYVDKTGNMNLQYMNNGQWISANHALPMRQVKSDKPVHTYSVQFDLKREIVLDKNNTPHQTLALAYPAIDMQKSATNLFWNKIYFFNSQNNTPAVAIFPHLLLAIDNSGNFSYVKAAATMADYGNQAPNILFTAEDSSPGYDDTGMYVAALRVNSNLTDDDIWETTGSFGVPEGIQNTYMLFMPHQCYDSDPVHYCDFIIHQDGSSHYDLDGIHADAWH